MKILDRFEAKCIPEPMSGCWLWTGSLDTGGYGCFGVGNRKTIGAHRFSYLSYVGCIPDGVHVRHRCDVRWCVNPEHLELGSPQDNANDKVRRGRHKNGRTERTHCPGGHEYRPENIRPNRKGRDCVTCHRNRERARRRN